jgi:YVTN family beta-propeller protein
VRVFVCLSALAMPSAAAAQRAYVLGIASAGPGAEAQIVTVIDTTTNAVVTTIAAGAGCTCLVDAERMAMSPDGARLYVVSSNKATNQDSILIISTATNTIIDTISVGRIANTIVLSPNGARLYVASWTPSGQSLMVIDTATKATITTIPYFDGGRGMAILPDGSRVYTSGIDPINSFDYPRIKVFDTAANVQLPPIEVAASYPSSGPFGFYPVSLDVHPNGSRLYVPDFRSAKMAVIDTSTNAVMTTVDGAPGAATAIGFTVRVSRDGTRALLGTNSATYILNTQTNSLIGSISGFTSAIAFTTDNSRIYLAGGAQIRVLNASTNAPITTIPLTLAVNGAAAAMVMSPPTRIMTLNPANLNFGATRVGVGATATLTIGNAGNSPLIVSSIAYPAGFSGNWPGGVVPPGGAQAVTVFFTPTPKPYSGTITVNANQTSGPTTVGVSGYGTIEPTRAADFDGDDRADVAVYRPSTGSWFVLRSGTAFTVSDGYAWGAAEDVPAAGDYDGDGRVDVAVFRPSTGEWWILQSGSGFTQLLVLQWGGSGDTPVPADFDGDGRTDIAVYRPSNGTWYVRRSSTNYSSAYGQAWGAGTDVPVAGDYDGDGLTDFAVFRPSSGHWFVLLSSNLSLYYSFLWGGPGDVGVPGDYDGDGRTDPAIYRPSNGTWYILRSGTNYGAASGYAWGVATDVPVPGDYDGDGKTDVAVFRPSSGHWFVLTSSSGFTAFTSYLWGMAGDMPVLKR